jgi:GNAT superfamily N-acetyltransferase
VSGAATVRLRRGRPDDASAIARVMRSAVRGQAGRYPAALLAAWGGLPPLYHRWAMTAGGERYLLAERGGLLLGYGAWRPAGSGRAEVTALFVRPSAGGRGLGGRLLARVAAAARRAGAARLTVVAARAAAPFYAAHGWRRVGGASSPLPGGARLPAVRLALAPPR